MRKRSLCAVAGVAASERTGEKKGNGGEMEGDEKERESRSKAALCLWKREKKTWR